MSNRQATKHVNILDYVIARLLREGVDDKAGEDDRDSAGDCTPSSEVSTGEMDDGSEDDRDSAVDCTPSNEMSTGEMDDGSDDDGVRRTVGDMTTEDSTRVTGDALGEVAKIPSTSIFSSLSRTASSRSSLSRTASSRSSLSRTASSRSSLFSISVSFSTVASLRTGVSCSRSMRSSSAMTSTRLETVETKELIVKIKLKRQKVKSKVSWNLQTTLVPRFVSLHAV